MCSVLPPDGEEVKLRLSLSTQELRHLLSSRGSSLFSPPHWKGVISSSACPELVLDSPDSEDPTVPADLAPFLTYFFGFFLFLAHGDSLDPFRMVKE